MNKTYPDLPGWTFDMDEVSAGVYQVTGVHAGEQDVVSTGTDPDAVVVECRQKAKRLQEKMPTR